jgi:hypothetical protein
VKVGGESEICFGGSQPDYASTDRLLRLHIAVPSCLASKRCETSCSHVVMQPSSGLSDASAGDQPPGARPPEFGLDLIHQKSCTVLENHPAYQPTFLKQSGVSVSLGVMLNFLCSSIFSTTNLVFLFGGTVPTDYQVKSSRPSSSYWQ